MAAKSGKKRKIIGGRTRFDAHVSESSRRYLLRQAKDPYTDRARKEGYRSRAAYKLLEIAEKHQLLAPGVTVVDLGAAPGGWSQVLARKLGGRGRIIAIDKLPMDALEGVEILEGDFTEMEVYERLLALCPEGAHLVLSDMAPETTGHASLDHDRSIMLAELAEDFALRTLKPGGSFVCKLFQGGGEVPLRDRLRGHFEKVVFEKPAASRKGSREVFLVALSFKERNT